MKAESHQKFVDKIGSSITRFASPGWSTRKAFARGGTHDARVQQKLESASAHFADGTSAAQSHMRI